MSEPLRIALVAEGVTDYEVIFAAISSILGERAFILNLLQPEQSLAFTGGGNVGRMGGGWEGVYHWTHSLRNRAGRISDDHAMLAGHHIFIMHLDADVASEDPANYTTRPYPELINDLPCQETCPPPSATTDRLRKVMVGWLGEDVLPSFAVLCTPSKAIEAWVIPICCPEDTHSKNPNWECRRDPANRLGQQPLATRFKKTQKDYRDRRDVLKKGWGKLVLQLTEAARFHEEFLAAAKTIS
jgi:hypothetical protein